MLHTSPHRGHSISSTSTIQYINTWNAFAKTAGPPFPQQNRFAAVDWQLSHLLGDLAVDDQLSQLSRLVLTAHERPELRTQMWAWHGLACLVCFGLEHEDFLQEGGWSMSMRLWLQQINVCFGRYQNTLFIIVQFPYLPSGELEPWSPKHFHVIGHGLVGEAFSQFEALTKQGCLHPMGLLYWGC